MVLVVHSFEIDFSGCFSVKGRLPKSKQRERFSDFFVSNFALGRGI
jgi:hypothetical protein